MIHDHAERGIKLRSLDEPWTDIDTATAMWAALLNIMARFAQLRVETIRENTNRGIEYAHFQGCLGGRPTVMRQERIAVEKTMREADPLTNPGHCAT